MVFNELATCVHWSSSQLPHGSKFAIAQAYQQRVLSLTFRTRSESAQRAARHATSIRDLLKSYEPWWVSDNNGGVATLYNGKALSKGRCNIPSPVRGVAGTPTGVVFTEPRLFLRSRRQANGRGFHFRNDGTIAAWGPGINLRISPTMRSP